MEYYKVYCSTHPFQFITNFCSDLNCLTGLCATCICEHTQSHMRLGTPPKYENIKNTYTRYNQRIRDQIKMIEEDKQWLNNVCFKIDQKRRNVKSTLSKARQDCLALINKHFDDLEDKISNQLVNDSKKNSLHLAFRLQTLNSLIIKQISNLLIYSNDLSSAKFIDTAKLVEEEVFPSSQDFHIRVCKELKQNQVYTASAIYRKNLLGELGFSLQKLVDLEFLLPRVEYINNPPRVQRVTQIRRPNSLKKSNSSMIVLPIRSDHIDFSMNKRNSTLQPKQTTSIIFGTNAFPLQQIQQTIGRQSEVSSPLLTKGSRLSSGLRVIRQSKREYTPKEDKSMTSSNVSYCGKQNESLAHSTFYDTGSNFFS